MAHVEAGLRSRDLTMPEEINRLLTDAHRRPAVHARRPTRDENLRAEGVAPERIKLVGNIMIDSLVRVRSRRRATWTACERVRP